MGIKVDIGEECVFVNVLPRNVIVFKQLLSNLPQCNDACDLPTIQYNFVSIADLANFNKDDIVGR